MKLFIGFLFFLVPVLAQIPCLDGTGPLQKDQVRCSDLFIADTALVPLTGVVGHLYSIVVTGDNSTKGRGDALKKTCETAEHCALIRIERNGEVLAEMDLDAHWHAYASDEDIADVLAAVLNWTNK